MGLEYGFLEFKYQLEFQSRDFISMEGVESETEIIIYSNEPQIVFAPLFKYRIKLAAPSTSVDQSWRSILCLPNSYFPTYRVKIKLLKNYKVLIKIYLIKNVLFFLNFDA